MPRKWQPRKAWRVSRRRVWERDKGHCQGPYCADKGDWSVPLDECHIDHIQSGKRGTNKLTNLRVLCAVCHALRADHWHQALKAKLLRQGLLPSD